MGQVASLQRRYLVEASKDKEHYTQTHAKPGCMEYKLIAQQAKEKYGKTEATPHGQIPK